MNGTISAGGTEAVMHSIRPHGINPIIPLSYICPTRTWCLGKSRLQRNLDIEKRECIGPATVGGSSPGSHKKTWVEKGILVLLRRGSQVHQRRVAGTPGQIFEIDAVGDGWLEPWVKENPAAQQPDWIVLSLTGQTINALA